MRLRTGKLIRPTLITVAFSLASVVHAAEAPLTFHKDVEPILQKNCQTCHRPGQIAPMSFLTYESSRPWAKAMKVAVAERKMPPWFANPKFGHFSNDRSLQQTDIEIITKWADSGAPEGSLADAPKAIAWPEGWVIQPDIVIDGPATKIPGKVKNNVIEWISVTVPSGLTQDTWVTSVQIKPEFPEATHHICIGYAPHKEGVKYFEPVWTDKPRDADGSAIPVNGQTFGGAGVGAARLEDCYLPGMMAADYRGFKAAKLLRAGTDIVFNLHYIPAGKDVTDHVKVGLTVTKEAPERRYVSLTSSSPSDTTSFAIPPNDPNWKSPPADAVFLRDAELVFMMPHMHFRGKDMTYTLEYPDGRKEIVLDVPHYDFNWQLGYETSIHVPKGTKLHVEAHFDNSRNNKFNPNPEKTVYYGEMTWEEMMLPFFGVVVDKNADTDKIVTARLGNGG
jgi:hypothetical protein